MCDEEGIHMQAFGPARQDSTALYKNLPFSQLTEMRGLVVEALVEQPVRHAIWRADENDWF